MSGSRPRKEEKEAPQSALRSASFLDFLADLPLRSHDRQFLPHQRLPGPHTAPGYATTALRGPLTPVTRTSSASSRPPQSAILEALRAQRFREAQQAREKAASSSRLPPSRRTSPRRVDSGDLDDVLASSSDSDSEVSDHLEKSPSHRRSSSAPRHSRQHTRNRRMSDSWEQLEEDSDGEARAPNGSTQYGYQSPLGEDFSEAEEPSDEERHYPGQTDVRKSRFWPVSRKA
ncbi:hypothetical protein JCM11251_002307 [Rhodosporidiobolus azoricus]